MLYSRASLVAQMVKNPPAIQESKCPSVCPDAASGGLIAPSVAGGREAGGKGPSLPGVNTELYPHGP